MLLVKKTNVNSKNKQDPNSSRYFLYKDSNIFFNGFHHYSHYIDYFSINCVPQLANKRGVSDSPVPVAKIDTAYKSNISILKKKITKMLV
jgi:hypothetical protein